MLELRLTLNEACWYPEEESGGHRDVYAFAQGGHAPQSSGSLIRVPPGTKIHVSVRNTLPLAAKIHGLHSHPGDGKDVVTLAPGEPRQLQFLAGDPCTLYLQFCLHDCAPQIATGDLGESGKDPAIRFAGERSKSTGRA